MRPLKYVQEMDEKKRKRVKAKGYRVTVVEPEDVAGVPEALAEVAG